MNKFLAEQSPKENVGETRATLSAVRRFLGRVAWKGGSVIFTGGTAIVAAYEVCNVASLLFTKQPVAPSDVGDWVRNLASPEWAGGVGHLATGAAAAVVEPIVSAPYALGEISDELAAPVSAVAGLFAGKLVDLGVEMIRH